MNHFVTNSPWDAALVRRRLAQRMDDAIGPQAWALDDTGWLKCGTASVCVTRQYTGTAGKVTNCQIGPLIVADAGYGDAAEFRQGLEDRNLNYIVGVNSAHTAFTIDTQRTAPPYKGAGRRPPLIYREVAPSLKPMSWPPVVAPPAG